MQCPTCKQELEPNVRFCPHDGTPLTETSSALPTRTPSATAAAPASKELELPVLIGGRYRLTELRGGGGMAKVYRADDVTLEREVAVKLINPDLRDEREFDTRFQREARIASQLNDPHIIVVHDFGIDATHGPFLVMEYLQGQSLRERLQSEGPLPYRAGLQLSAQLLLALIHAHGKDIVHRDIKPDNVFLLNQSGVRLHVRVLDFGIARIFRRGEPGHAETLTNPGAVLGTPRYMSPEQLAGQPLGVRSDLYSAALVIHEALTGQLPYVSGKKLNELCPEAPPILQDVLDQCLKPNPAERPVSAVEVYLRLQELGKASGILLLPPGAMDRLVSSRQAAEPTVAYTPPQPPRLWRRPSLIAALCLLPVLIGLAVLAKFYFGRTTPADPRLESLLSVQIDDPQRMVVDRLQLRQGAPMNPWATNRRPSFLAHLLKPEDLGLPQEALAQLDIRWNSNNNICAIFFEDRLRALIVQEPLNGSTGRGLKPGDRSSRLMDVYPEDPSDVTVLDIPGSDAQVMRPLQKIEIRRYDALGIGFEMHDRKVTAITLYPVVRNP
jgi:serine/threonine-protein kinase